MEPSHPNLNGAARVSNPLRLLENHFFSLPSQGNIYTLVLLQTSSGKYKILVASLQKKIFYIEYVDGKYEVLENPLDYIPNGADIIALNAHSRKGKHNVALTMIVKDNSCEKSILNLYCDWTIERNMSLNEEIASFTSIALGFTPYALYYTLLPSSPGSETAWLVSGSDRVIHLFRPSRETKQYQEFPSSSLFPEFDAVHGITLHIDISYSEDRKSRFTHTSGESGNVHLFEVDASSPDDPLVRSSREINFDFPASAIKVFYRRPRTSDLSHLGIDSVTLDEESTEAGLNGPLILITTTLESCFVHGLGALDNVGSQLVESENFDVVTCCVVADVDFDGANEILLGTYGQEVLIYKEGSRGTWDLHQTLSLPSPVLALAFRDVLGDGVRELVVSTMMGLHIFQFDPAYVKILLLDRLQRLKKLRS